MHRQTARQRWTMITRGTMITRWTICMITRGTICMITRGTMITGGTVITSGTRRTIKMSAWIRISIRISINIWLLFHEFYIQKQPRFWAFAYRVPVYALTWIKITPRFWAFAVIQNHIRRSTRPFLSLPKHKKRKRSGHETIVTTKFLHNALHLAPIK